MKDEIGALVGIIAMMLFLWLYCPEIALHKSMTDDERKSKKEAIFFT